MVGELLPIELPIRVPSHHMVMEDLVAHLQLSPRPSYLAHPVRALLTFIQELYEDRRLRSHSLFTEEAQYTDFVTHANADIRFVQCYDVLGQLDREIHVVCGRVGFTPKEVREELQPIMDILGPMMKWPFVDCQFRTHLNDTVKGWNSHWYIPHGEKLEHMQRTVAIGRMLSADYYPALDLASNLWDNVRGREEIVNSNVWYAYQSHQADKGRRGLSIPIPKNPRSKGGKRPLIETNPHLVNLYDMVLLEWSSGRPSKRIIEALQAKRDVMELANGQKLEIDVELIRNAKKYRKDNPKS